MIAFCENRDPSMTDIRCELLANHPGAHQVTTAIGIHTWKVEIS